MPGYGQGAEEHRKREIGMERSFQWIWIVGLVLMVSGAVAKGRSRPVAPPAEVGPNAPLVLGKGTVRMSLVLDPATGELTARFLEGTSEEPVRVVQEKLRVTGTLEGKTFVILLDAVSDIATGEKKWDTSIFRGRSADLVGVQTFGGTLFFVRLKGINYSKVRFLYRTEAGGTPLEVATVTSS